MSADNSDQDFDNFTYHKNRIQQLFHFTFQAEKINMARQGLIPRQRNTSRETVYAKYGWLHMNNSIEFSLREQKIRFASE